MSIPKVSVILPVYNAEKYIEEAIKSILNQKYTDFELIVINDGSTDSSKEIISKIKDERIVYVQNDTNQGLVYTLNKGLSLAKGKYIARMDADDISLPDRLHLQVNFLEKNHEIGIVGTNIILFGNNCKKKIVYAKNHEDIFARSLLKAPFCHASCMFRRKVFKDFGIKYEDFLHAEDFMLWLRILKVTKGYNLQQFLYKVRNNQSSVSNQYRSQQIQSGIKAVLYAIENFLKLSLDENEKQILYKTFFDQVYDFNHNEIKQFIFLYTKIINANNTVGYFPESKFAFYISRYVFHKIKAQLNNYAMRTFIKSELYNYYQGGMRLKIKYFFYEKFSKRNILE
ncbi:MAG: hypothetical protein KatS3mg034_2182 [Vicingaceae bacterium]|nr:MAG: hypothetical protein KatS3mg034_2182 [Vicingaceae bacterium]